MQANNLLSIISEYSNYNQILHYNSGFPIKNIHGKTNYSRIVVFFRFKCVQFNKKRTLPFFLALELITNRKGIPSLSIKNRQSLNLRKGSLVGCSVVLRKQVMFDFIDLLLLTFGRRTKFKINRLYILKYIQKFNSKNRQNSDFSFDSSFALHLKNLLLFYPIEYSIGIHPDLQSINIQFMFNTFLIEDVFFMLRYYKIPILDI